MGIRRKARECALQILFQSEYSPAAVQNLFTAYWSATSLSTKIREYAEQLVLGVCSRMKEIDAIISENAHNWRLARMTRVDRNILRVAVYEFLSDEDIPWNVVINEALEIAKKYSTEESAHFINGILDGVKNRLEGAETG